MHKIRELMMKDLYEYEEKAKKMSGIKLSAGDVENLYKITGIVKNIDEIGLPEGDREGYSEDTSWMGDGHIYGTSYEGVSSYARGGGRGRGRNARRDSRGRYSREGGNSYDRGGQQGGQGGNRGGGYSSGGAKEYMIGQLEEMMDEVDTERERKAIQRCMDALEES